MNNSEVFDRLVKALDRRAEYYSLDNRHDALIHWWGEYALGLDPDEIHDRIVRDSNAEGIDALLLDTDGYRQVFVQAKTVVAFEHTTRNYPENDIKNALHGLRFLLKGDYRGRITPQLENLIDEFHDNDRTHEYKAEMVFLALKAGPVDTKYIEQFKAEFPDLAVRFVDATSLFDFYTTEYLPMRQEPPPEVTFKVRPGFLRKDHPRKSWVFAAEGEDLARAYHEFGQRLLEQNVRLPLGARKRSINYQIIETATDKEAAGDFWYFNNGVTFVCSTLRVTTNDRVVTLERPQIINGAQTTYALHEAFTDGVLQQEVEVLIRAIETTDLVFSDRVTLYANSQNTIRLRDLRSNDRIQVEIQRVLLDSFGFFYVRRRGEWESNFPTDEAAASRLGSDFRAKRIDNEEAAQSYLAVYLDKPSQSKSAKGRIFMKDGGLYDSIFRPSVDSLAEKLLLSWLLLRYAAMKKEAYRKDYSTPKAVDEKTKAEILAHDFLFHTEYFIANFLGDFLRHRQMDIDTRTGVLAAIGWLKEHPDDLEVDYRAAVNALAAGVSEARREQGDTYYHNRFFKSEPAIVRLRREASKTLNFIRLL